MSEQNTTPRRANKVLSDFSNSIFAVTRQEALSAMWQHTAEHTAVLQAELNELKLANKALKGSHESALLLRIKLNRLEAENKRLRYIADVGKKFVNGSFYRQPVLTMSDKTAQDFSVLKALLSEYDSTNQQEDEYCKHTAKEREEFGERTVWTCLGCNKPINQQ